MRKLCQGAGVGEAKLRSVSRPREVSEFRNPLGSTTKYEKYGSAYILVLHAQPSAITSAESSLIQHEDRMYSTWRLDIFHGDILRGYIGSARGSEVVHEGLFGRAKPAKIVGDEDSSTLLAG